MQVFENIEGLLFVKFKEDSLADTNYYNKWRWLEGKQAIQVDNLQVITNKNITDGINLYKV